MTQMQSQTVNPPDDVWGDVAMTLEHFRQEGTLHHFQFDFQEGRTLHYSARMPLSAWRSDGIERVLEAVMALEDRYGLRIELDLMRKHSNTTVDVSHV